MDLFTRDDLELLLAPRGAPCISLYMPAHRHRPEADQDPIRFRNLLKRAEALLLERAPAREVREILGPVSELPDTPFWRHQRDGLAVFRARDLLRHYLLPMRLPELVVVAGSFHVKPLLRFLQANMRFYVLSLSQNTVSLHEGTPFSLAPVELTSLPGPLADLTGAGRRESFLNVRTVRSGSKAPMFHGHGGAAASKKDDLQRYFRLVDRAVRELLRDEPAPLVLAGVGYYFPIYAEVSRLTDLLEGGVEGNVEEASAEDLHAQVWPFVREAFRRREEAALADHAAAAARGLATEDLSVVARMTVQGRVRRLLLAEGAHAWGRLDRETGQVDLAASRSGPEEDDVLDDLAEGVLARGGEVMLVSPERLGAAGPVAATLRW